MMKKQLSVKELKMKFIKDKQRETLNNPIKIEDYLESYLSESEKQELFTQLNELVSDEKEFSLLVESSIDLSKLWHERIAPSLTTVKSSEDIKPIPMITIVLIAHSIMHRFVVYRSTEDLQSRESNIWQLLTVDGNENIMLPTEVALRCYGKTEQGVLLRLHCIPVAEEGTFEPQLEVEPAPTHGTLIFLLSFANGDMRTLTIPVPRRRHSNAWSIRCEPVSSNAFGIDKWEVIVGMGNVNNL